MASSWARSSSVAGCGFSGRTESSVRSASSAGRGPRTSAPRKTSQSEAVLACEPGVAKGVLGGLRPLLEPAAVVRDAIAERVPDPCQSGVVFCLLEERQRRPCEPLELVDGRHRLQTASRAWAATTRASASPTWSPAARARSAACSATAAAWRGTGCASARSSSKWTSSRSGRVNSSARSSSGAAARSSVRQSARRPAAASRSPARSRQRRVRLPQLGLVASRLLEVVAEDLVRLDEIVAVLFEPVGEALVQFGSGGLGQGVVGGVADQQVAEAEGVVSGELGPVGADQLLAHERGQARCHLAVVREGLDGAAVEDLPLDRAPLEHRALRGVELVEAGGEQGLERRRDGDLAFCLRGHRHHLGHEQRVAARPRGRSARGGLRRRPSGISSSTSVSGSGSSRSSTGQSARPLGQFRPGEAEQQHRRAAGEQGDVLDEVEEGLLAPLDVVEDADERRLLLQQLAKRPRDLLGRGRGSFVSPRRERSAAAAAGSEGKTVELLQHLDDRPVRDPLPVGQAASADRRRLDRRRGTRPSAATCRRRRRRPPSPADTAAHHRPAATPAATRRAPPPGRRTGTRAGARAPPAARSSR